MQHGMPPAAFGTKQQEAPDAQRSSISSPFNEQGTGLQRANSRLRVEAVAPAVRRHVLLESWIAVPGMGTSVYSAL